MPYSNTDLLCYKEVDIEFPKDKKKQFFLEKHSTKEGSWAALTLLSGECDVIFLDGDNKELLRKSLNQQHREILIPPSSWHKIIPVSSQFKMSLKFLCKPHRYFAKKYKLGNVHSDLLTYYFTYLQDKKALNILDVGCGKGRNLLFLSLLGHQVHGIDHNVTSLNGINQIIEQEQLTNISTTPYDLNTPLELDAKQYELIVSTVSLQFLQPERIPSLLEELRAVTAINGLHFIVYPISSELYSSPENFTYLPQSKALYKSYQDAGWTVIEYKETIGHLHKLDADGKLTQGMFGLILVQKSVEAIS